MKTVVIYPANVYLFVRTQEGLDIERNGAVGVHSAS